MHISFLFRITSTLLVVLFTTTWLVNLSGKRLREHYFAIGEMQTNNVTSLVAVNTVASLLDDEYSQVSFIKDEDDLIFDTYALNTLLKEAINNVYYELKRVESGTSELFVSKLGKGIIYEIPFNFFFKNVLLSGFGPKLPVKYSLVGDVKGNIYTEVEDFGINNAIIHIKLKIEMSSRVSIPLCSNVANNSISTVLYSRMFEGEVPFSGSKIEGVNEYYSEEVAI